MMLRSFFFKKNILFVGVLLGCIFTIQFVATSIVRADSDGMDYIRSFNTKPYSYRLKKDIYIFDKDGEVVGFLKAGCLLNSPTGLDVTDTDPGDNTRAKLLLDLERAFVEQSIEKYDKEGLNVYDVLTVDSIKELYQGEAERILKEAEESKG